MEEHYPKKPAGLQKECAQQTQTTNDHFIRG